MTSLVLLSGGLDSAALLAGAVADDPDGVSAVAYDYGQRSDRELEHAGMLADYYRVTLDVVDLSSWGGLLGGCALTDRTVEIPAGSYGDPAQAVTVVPARLATLISAAVGIADVRGHGSVLVAAHAGHAPLYPDTRPGFLDAIDAAARAATDDRVRVSAPFLGLSREQVASYAVETQVPIALTWSCYLNGSDHCGACGACSSRRDALRAAGFDPTVYEAEPA